MFNVKVGGTYGNQFNFKGWKILYLQYKYTTKLSRIAMNVVISDINVLAMFS
jgi:hypothetical protein